MAETNGQRKLTESIRQQIFERRREELFDWRDRNFSSGM